MLGAYADGPPVVTSCVSDMLTERELEGPGLAESLLVSPDFSKPTDTPVVQRDITPEGLYFVKILGGIIVALLFGLVAVLQTSPYNAVMTQMSSAFERVMIDVGLSLPEPGEGLDIPAHLIKPSRDLRAGVEYLIVEGKVSNNSDHLIAVTPLRVSLTNADGKVVASEVIELSEAALKPGQSLPYKAEFENPPGSARSMKLDFVAREP